MKKTRRIKVTSTRRRSAQFSLVAVRAYCPACAREVETLSQAMAAEVLEVDSPALDGLLAAGLLHAIHTVSGSLRVCRDSLFPKQEVKDDTA